MDSDYDYYYLGKGNKQNFIKWRLNKYGKS